MTRKPGVIACPCTLAVEYEPNGNISYAGNQRRIRQRRPTGQRQALIAPAGISTPRCGRAGSREHVCGRLQPQPPGTRVGRHGDGLPRLWPLSNWTGRGFYEGYKRDGALGVANSVNPLYAVGVAGADVVIGARQGDDRRLGSGIGTFVGMAAMSAAGAWCW